MARYVIEWQMGGEMVLDYAGNSAPSNLEDFALQVLNMKAGGIGEDVADDAGAVLKSADGAAEITFRRLS